MVKIGQNWLAKFCHLHFVMGGEGAIYGSGHSYFRTASHIYRMKPTQSYACSGQYHMHTIGTLLVPPLPYSSTWPYTDLMVCYAGKTTLTTTQHLCKHFTTTHAGSEDSTFHDFLRNTTKLH